MISECPLFDVLRGSCRFCVEAIVADGIIIREIDTGRCFTLSPEVSRLSQADLCEIAAQAGLNLGLHQVK
ncbi:hypothetical protein JOE25_000904 [Serratia sp. PL17]|nr:hypothetical protein [Serratia sp. PL17]